MINSDCAYTYRTSTLEEELRAYEHDLHCWYNIIKFYQIFYPNNHLQQCGYWEALTKADNLCYPIAKIRDELELRNL